MFFHSGLSVSAPFRKKCKVTETGSLISQTGALSDCICVASSCFSVFVLYNMNSFCKELSVRAQALARSLDK